MQPILVTGAAGTLGNAFVRACRMRSLAVVPLTRVDLDIANERQLAAALDRWKPWAVINAAGYARVDDAEHDAAACWRTNTTGADVLARGCADTGVQLATVSSDLVFDGAASRPYVESDRVAPLSVYGESKVAAERAVLDGMPSALVVRTSAFFGPWDRHDFATCLMRELRRGRRVPVATDVTVTATYVPELTHAVLDLLIDAESGIWHVVNPGPITWEEFARLICRTGSCSESGIMPVPEAELGWIAPRPRYSALGTERGELLAPLHEAIERWGRERIS